jgi:molybdenum-dependent DNA-binding transcriptional regulator ModE
MNRLLSVSLIESSSGGEEGGGDQQMSPELLNKAFSTKSTQYMR